MATTGVINMLWLLFSLSGGLWLLGVGLLRTECSNELVSLVLLLLKEGKWAHVPVTNKKILIIAIKLKVCHVYAGVCISY